MAKAELDAKLREAIKGSEKTALKEAGFIPAVVYGKGFKNVSVAVDAKKLGKLISGEAGRNVIISLALHEGEKVRTIPVLTHEIERDIFSDRIKHVDFLHVEMKKEIKAKIKLELKGISVGVKEYGGIMVHGLREIEVKCLPTDIPDKFELDVTALKIGDTLHVSDIAVKAGVEIITPATETLVHISQPVKEEELLAPAAAVSAADIPSEKGAAFPTEVAAAPAGKPGAEAKKGEKAAATGQAPAAGAKGTSPAAPAKGAAPAAPTAKPEKK
jgi:large subunit ribosomal protein L25